MCDIQEMYIWGQDRRTGRNCSCTLKACCGHRGLAGSGGFYLRSNKIFFSLKCFVVVEGILVCRCIWFALCTACCG